MATDTDQAPAPGQGTALAAPVKARPVKVYEPVADVVPILDTARFEHMQRIATIMAGSSLIPDSLRQEGKGDNKTDLPRETVIANCFLIVNQAVRWGMDCFAVAASTSVVHGRLMYEGKLVAAVLESKLGCQLKYEFGTWDPATETVDLSKEGTGDALGVRVSGQREGDKEPVYIEGSVGIWKTTGSNSPWKPGAMKRQCRYRGAREWSRAFAPGLMLGVITDDELDVLTERRETQQRISGRGAAALPGARPLQAGFGDETDNIARKAPQGDEKASGSEGAKEGGKATSAASEGQTQGDLLGADEKPRKDRGDQLIAMFDLGREAAGEGEAREAPADLDDEEAEKWLEGWDTKAEDLAAEERAMLEPSVAPAGEVYMIVGEGYSDAGRRKTYKDGASHSSVGEKGAANLKEYDQHAPVLEEKTPPPKKEAKEEASPEGDEGEPSEPTAESPASSSDEPPPADEDDFPGDRKSGGETNPFAAAHEKMVGAASWPEIKKCLQELSVTDAYKAAEAEGRRMVRLWAYEAYKELREAGKEPTEPTQDMTLFRFWLEFDAESEEQINSLFRSFHRGEAYANASDSDKRVLGALISDRKAALAEPKG